MNEKEKRRLKRKRNKLSGRTITTCSPPKPGYTHTIEQLMQGILGAPEDEHFDAQALAYEAMEAQTPERALRLAGRALELNPRCVDALLILARSTRQSPEALIESVRAAVHAGEEDLGSDFFKDNRGYFWGILETRPYMRARAFLAELLADAGKVSEAVEHLETMLKLNPNDNQGMRYVLLGHYLALDRLDEAQRLLKQYDGDGSAMFAWGRVLERFLSGDQSGATAALQAARQLNRFAEDYLRGSRQVPSRLPEFYGIGDANEGVVCAVELAGAWGKHATAVQWLKTSR